MSALAMTAYQWYIIHFPSQLAGQFCTFENGWNVHGWNVLLGLYTAAYGGYDPLRVSPTNKSRTAQSDETTKRVLGELRIWVEQSGM